MESNRNAEGVRLANTITNAAFPLAGIAGAFIVGGLWGWGFFVVMAILGIASGLWHWFFHPYNRLDRYAMYLVLAFLLGHLLNLYLLPPFLTLLLIALDLTVTWFAMHSFYVIGLLVIVIGGLLITDAGLLRGGLACAVLGIALAISETDETQDRTGYVHPVWHLLTAGGLLYIFLL